MTIRDVKGCGRSGLVEVSVTVTLTSEELDALWNASDQNLGDLNRALQRALFKGMETECGFEPMDPEDYAERER